MKTMAEFRRRLQQAKELGSPKVKITAYDPAGAVLFDPAAGSVRSISQQELCIWQTHLHGLYGLIKIGPAKDWQFEGHTATSVRNGKRVTIEFLPEQAS